MLKTHCPGLLTTDSNPVIELKLVPVRTTTQQAGSTQLGIECAE